MATKIEKFFRLYSEEKDEVTGYKFRNIDDALAAAENYPNANQVVYVVEQDGLAFYSKTSFKEAEEELKAEKKKIATQKMLATKAAKKNQKEAENEVADIPVVEEKKEESNDIEQEPLEEPKQENQAMVPDSSDPKVGDVFISEKKDKAVIVKKVTKKCIVVDMLKIEFADHGSKNVSMLLDWYIFKKDIAGFQPYDNAAFSMALGRAKEMLAPIVF